MRKALVVIAFGLAAMAWQVSAASAAVVWTTGDGADAGTNDDALASMIQRAGPFDKFLYLGDVYDNGTAQEYSNYYDPGYGRFKSITAPTTGNHEWANIATGYDPYWGSLAPKPNGGHYYSFDLAGWHIISLSSEAAHTSGSAQLWWLQQDLAKYPGTCTIAYWHQPRYSAAEFGDLSDYEPFWAALEGHASVVLNGHHHGYQRLKPTRGMTEFVVGSGGHFFHGLNLSDSRLASGENTAYGALRMNLQYGKMDYAFYTLGGHTFDSGSTTCTPSGPPPPNSAPTASFNYSPQAPTTAQAVTFSSTSSDPDGTIASYSWDLNGDGVYGDASGATASQKFSKAGTYTVGLRVTDNQGATSTVQRSLTVGNQAPSASFTYTPSPPIPNEQVTFTSTSADPDGVIASQAWDLDNDGQFNDGTGASAQHSFPSTGKYTVRLRVTDDSGASSTVSRVVTVSKKRNGRSAKIFAPLVFGGRSNAPRIRIASPLPTVQRRQPHVLRGFALRAGQPIRLVLRRHARGRCYVLDGRRWRSCRSHRVSFFAGGTRAWAYRLPLDLPRGKYTLKAIVRGTDGRLAAQSVSFRMAAPVRVKHAPPLPTHDVD